MNPSLVSIVRDLELIRANLPRYKNHLMVTRNMKSKASKLEEQFLDELQKVRITEGPSERYTAYSQWYKTYKGIETL